MATKEIGIQEGWQPDYAATRDNYGKWTVYQSYRSRSVSWDPPRWPVIAIAPQVPLYDYSVSRVGDFYMFRCEWAFADNESAATDSPGKLTDRDAMSNSYGLSRSTSSTPLHRHPYIAGVILEHDEDEENAGRFPKLYELIRTGALHDSEGSVGVSLVPSNLDDGSYTFEVLREYNVLATSQGYQAYAALRDLGITDPLVPNTTYDITKSEGISYDPLKDSVLQTIIQKSEEKDETSFQKVSTVTATDSYGNTTTTESFSNGQ